MFFDIERDGAVRLLSDMVGTVDGRWRHHCAQAGMTAREIALYRPAFDHEEHRFARRLSAG